MSGRLIDHTFRSRALLKHMRLCIYLPPVDGGPYPVVYLLHPWGYNERFWVEELAFHEQADQLIGAGVIPPFLAVMPQGDKSYFINAADPAGDYTSIAARDPDMQGALHGYGDYGDYLINDVRQEVLAHYPAAITPQAHTIAGAAMGGLGAAVLAFSHPKHFGAVALHNPTLFAEPGFGPPWIFGLNDDLAFSARSPLALAQALPRNTLLRIHIDTRLDDDHADLVGELHRTLDARGIPHHYFTAAADDPVGYLRDHIAEYLGFYIAGW